eukprot:489762-Prorocentrum_minimum.AAC.4
MYTQAGVRPTTRMHTHTQRYPPTTYSTTRLFGRPWSLDPWNVARNENLLTRLTTAASNTLSKYKCGYTAIAIFLTILRKSRGSGNPQQSEHADTALSRQGDATVRVLPRSTVWKIAPQVEP